MPSANVNTAFCSPVTLTVGTPFTSTAVSTHRSTSNINNRVAPRRPIVAIVDLRDEQTKLKEQEQVEIQRVTDPAPGPYAYFAEQLNGRAAMIGFVAGLLVELKSGVTMNNQIALIAGNVAKQGFLMLSPFIELMARSIAHQ